MNGFEALAATAADAVRALTGATGFAVTRWLLASVFVVAGVTKVRRPALAALALVEFGIARTLRRNLGTLLGIAELVLAAILMTGSLAHIGLPIAAGALWIFTFVIARALRRGESFPCFCLGDAEGDMSRWTLLRTGGLAGLASLQAASAPAVPAVAGAEVAAAVAGVSLVGCAFLASRVAGLLRWNAGTRRPPVMEAP